MKRLILSLFLSILLVGCTGKLPTAEEKKAAIVEQGVVFNKEFTNSLISSESEQYKSLYSLLYQKAIDTLTYDQGSDTFTIAVYDLSEYKKIIKADVNGFQKDYENMLSLEVQQGTIDNYIWSYIRNALGAVKTESYSFSLDLGENNSLADDKVICDYLQKQMTAFHEASIDYNTEEEEEEWVAPEKNLNLGQGVIMPVSCKEGTVNCFVRVDKIIKESEAIEYVQGLSSINKNIVVDDAVVVTYTVINLSENEVTFTDKMCSVDENGSLVTYNGSEIAGLENSKKLEPYIETTITNMYVVVNSGGLLWFDEKTKNLLEVSLD